MGSQQDAIKLPKLHVYHISQQLPARSDTLQAIRQATQTDDELALLKHTIMTSWPANIREIPQILHPYWTFCEELTIEDPHHYTNKQMQINSDTNPQQPPRAYKM